MGEAIFTGLLWYAALALAGAVSFLAVLVSRNSWLAVIPIVIGFVAAGAAPGACEHALPAGMTCTSDRPGAGTFLYFIPGFAYAAICAWIFSAVLTKFGLAVKDERVHTDETSADFGASGAPSRGAKRLAALLPAVVIALVLVGSVVIWFSSRDLVLAGARDFVASSPQVLASAGTSVSTSLASVRRYAGTPGKDEGYREYEFAAAGSRGSAHVTVRIRDVERSRYELVSVKERLP